MAPPMILFSTQILALTLKSDNFVVNSAVSNQEIEEFFKQSHFIQPSLDNTHLRKHNLKDALVQWKFMDIHCHMTWYLFQVKNCLYCIEHPIHMPAKVLDSFHYHDWTGKRSNNCPFSKLFGEEPSDVD